MAQGIGLRTGAGERQHRIALSNPGAPVPDADGGYVQTFAALNPAAVWARIQPATAADLERLAAGTVVSTASHVVTMPYHPGVTTQTRIMFGARRFSVTGVQNPEERNAETVAICEEIVT